MKTLAHLYLEIDEHPSSPGWSAVSRSSKKELLITIRRVAEMLDYPVELIDIGEIDGSDFEKQLVDYVCARKVRRQSVVRYLCMKNRLLAFAFACR